MAFLVLNTNKACFPQTKKTAGFFFLIIFLFKNDFLQVFFFCGPFLKSLLNL